MVPAVFLLLASQIVTPPTLCVALHAEPNLQLDDLLAAMRARIARSDVRVIACDKAKPSELSYRLEVVADRGTVALAITGRDLEARRTVSVEGMSSTEIVQTISLTAVEAVRPSMEKLLREMGSLAPPERDLVEELEKQKCPEPEPCKEPQVVFVDKEVFRPAAWELDLMLGPIFGADPDGATPVVSGYVELAPAVWVGEFGLALHTGFNFLPRRDASGASLQVWEIELGASVLWAAGPVRFSVGAQNRLTAASGSGGSPFLREGTQFFWNGGFALGASWSLWSSDRFALGVDTRVWLWPQPNRFLIAGEPLVRQGHVEFFLGPSSKLIF